MPTGSARAASLRPAINQVQLNAKDFPLFVSFFSVMFPFASALALNVCEPACSQMNEAASESEPPAAKAGTETLFTIAPSI